MNMDNETLRYILDTWKNLDEVMERAGGKLNVSSIAKMTALEFIAHIAPNKIRFTMLTEYPNITSATSFDKSIL